MLSGRKPLAPGKVVSAAQVSLVPHQKCLKCLLLLPEGKGRNSSPDWGDPICPLEGMDPLPALTARPGLGLPTQTPCCMFKIRSSEAGLGHATSPCSFTWEELSEKGLKVSPLRTSLAHILQAAPASLSKTNAEQIEYNSTGVLSNFKMIGPTTELKVEFLQER